MICVCSSSRITMVIFMRQESAKSEEGTKRYDRQAPNLALTRRTRRGSRNKNLDQHRCEHTTGGASSYCMNENRVVTVVVRHVSGKW
mmetsp:Transcript_13162/g.39809  ORF Transcript_13162/g.39809 Transcript_13162/m.39809 type:complete len:87 (-) Transcript_13162:1634-1894(-)